MDQEKDAGHHAITREAARELFEKTAVDDHGTRRIDGMDFEQFYTSLDEGQEHADRIVGGDTWKPYWADREAQRRHSMADPALSGEENLEAIQGFVTGQLDNAKSTHDALRNFDALDTDRDSFLSQEELTQGEEQGLLQGRAASYLKANESDLEELSNDEWGDENDGVTREDLRKSEMRSLGAATHAVEDSFSNAHMFRDNSDTADPHAPVESINVFNPVGFGADDTHVEAFDKVPVDTDGNLIRGSDRAAAAASTEMLDSYLTHRDDGESSAHGTFDSTVGSFYQPSSGGVGVNTNEDDPNWQAERDERLKPQEPIPMGDYPAPSEDVALG